MVSLYPDQLNDGHFIGRWDLSYLLRPDAWGQGFATESCRAAMEYLQRECKDQGVTVRACVDIANRRSLRVLAKLAFEFDKHEIFGGPKRFLGGEWRPHEIMFFKKRLQ